MHTMTLAATKAQLSAVVDQVQNGEEVVITRRGHPVARIVAETRQTPTDPRWIDDLAPFVDAQKPATENSVAAMRGQEKY
jgi:prevent-host-death family protein